MEDLFPVIKIILNPVTQTSRTKQEEGVGGDQVRLSGRDDPIRLINGVTLAIIVRPGRFGSSFTPLFPTVGVMDRERRGHLLVNPTFV